MNGTILEWWEGDERVKEESPLLDLKGGPNWAWGFGEGWTNLNDN